MCVCICGVREGGEVSVHQAAKHWRKPETGKQAHDKQVLDLYSNHGRLFDMVHPGRQPPVTSGRTNTTTPAEVSTFFLTACILEEVSSRRL